MLGHVREEGGMIVQNGHEMACCSLPVTVCVSAYVCEVEMRELLTLDDKQFDWID